MLIFGGVVYLLPFRMYRSLSNFMSKYALVIVILLMVQKFCTTWELVKPYDLTVETTNLNWWTPDFFQQQSIQANGIGIDMRYASMTSNASM